ncbi:hypothetical protein BK659_24080 [Pseudomonas brassicacearum]|uniref:Lipoprotein n=2 Tax=Pseudomonas brassicacearum TaxID=930166 RepID=A0A423GVI0_9PSED|nr:hypothetical protein BK659_24080 [Pseudomonas brassicacearum]
MLRLLSVSLFALFLTGCASSAKIENMQVNPAQAQTYDVALRDNMKVDSVGGGSTTNPLWTSQIESADFRSALEQSLSNAGLLGQNSKANYTLRANLVSLDQPLFGLNFTVTSMVEYSLVENATGRVIWTDKVKAPFTAGVGDSFFGVKRLRLANEGSARENINELLKRLAGLKLGAGQVSLAQ